MENVDDRALLLMLSELRELNRLRSENKRSIEEVVERLQHLQEVFDAIENKGYVNRTLIREINSNLLRLSILSNPETANMFRRRIESTTVGQVELSRKRTDQGYYTVTTGLQVLEVEDYLLLEFVNPFRSERVICLSTTSIGSSGNTSIDICRNMPLACPGVALTPRNLNTGFNDSSFVTIKYAIRNNAVQEGGQLLSSFIQAEGPVMIDYQGRLILSEGNSLTFCLKNLANKSNVLTTNISWFEEAETSE
ncbi:hypothetical protein CEB3_c05880 [Peptococcaceae bacterium CEB3]|nr:hypothetical protein CEB3_c05880 [Peptococcaceae bacterium CEB3]